MMGCPAEASDRSPTVLAERLVHRLGSHGRQEFTFRIRPLVLVPGLEIHRARRDQCEQHVGVHGQFVDVVAELLVIAGELVSEIRVEMLPSPITLWVCLVCATARGNSYSRSSPSFIGALLFFAPTIGVWPHCYNEPKMIQTLFGSVEQEPSLLERLKSGVAKTRAGLVSRLEDTLAGRKEIDADLLDELEYTLISADIGVQTTAEILERIRQRVARNLVGDVVEL